MPVKTVIDRTLRASRAERAIERVTYALLSGALRALSILSLTWQRRLGRCAGRLIWCLRLDGARTTLTNLAICFPHLDGRARRRLARQSLEHTAMLAAEAGAVYRWPQRRWSALAVELEGVHLLEQAGDDGRGLLVLAPHFGNWEYLGLVLGQFGVTALYVPPRIRAMDRIVRNARNRTGATLLPIDTAGLRGFYQALAGGGVTALLPDQVPSRQAGVYANFFGRPALTMTLAHRLIRRTGTRVVMGVAVRCRGGFRVRFEEMAPALCDADPLVSATAMNRAIENLVREDPAQYQWEYRRFRRPPRGEPSPYDGAPTANGPARSADVRRT